MFDDLTKEIKAQLYERAKGPLFTTFAISWISFNIRSITVFFSDLDPERKIGYWNEFYPTTADWLLHCLAYPFIAATVVIIVYPIPARLAYHYWHWQFLKIKKIQQKLEDETPMTHEEAGALRLVSLEQQSKLQEQLRTSTLINTEQSNRLAAMTQQIIDSTASIDKLTQEKNQLIEDNRLFEDKFKNSKSESKVTSTKSKNDKYVLTSKLPNNVLKVFLESNVASSLLIEVFLTIYINDGSIDKVSLKKSLKANSGLNGVEVENALDELNYPNQYITQRNGNVSLANLGRSLAVSSGLPEVSFN